MCNYADDTTFHACDLNFEGLVKRSEHDTMLATEWFESNYVKLNEERCQEKCHFLKTARNNH